LVESEGIVMDRTVSSQYDKMTKTPIEKLIISLGIPTIVSMLITNIYNMADTYFVGRLNTSASGAVGIVFGVMAVLQAFGFMCGQGAGSSMSRKLGEKDIESASYYASTGLAMALIMGLIIGGFGLLFLNPFMRLLGSTDTILPYARQYGMCILIAAPFMTGSCVLNNILRYEGKAVYAMVGLTVGGILNMIGDPIFMFVFHLGTLGAGISTAVSQIISFGILLYMVKTKKTVSKVCLRFVKLSIGMMVDISTIGFPSLIRQGLSSISTIVLNQMAAPYGDAAIAAMSIVGRMSMFIFSVGLGLGQGYQPVAAYNFGARRYDRVKQGMIFTFWLGTILIGIFSAVTFVFTRPLIVLFRDDQEVVEFGFLAMRVQCISLLTQSFVLNASMLFQSCGKRFIAAMMSLFRSGIMFLPLIVILPRFLGFVGVQIAQPIADVLSCIGSIPFVLRFFHQLDKSMEEMNV